MVGDIDGPIARAVVFSRPVRGFDTRGLRLLGPLHIELSRGQRWNHPPLQQPAPPPVPADRVEVSSILLMGAPPPQYQNKNKMQRGTTHLQQHAPPPVLEGIDGRPHPSIGGTGARTGSFRAGAECATARAAAASDRICPTLENGYWYPLSLLQHAPYTPEHTHVCASIPTPCEWLCVC